MTLRSVSLTALLAGVGLLAYAVWTGQADAGLFIILPFVVGSGPIPFLGTILVMLGISGLFATIARPAEPRDAGPGTVPAAGSGRAPADEAAGDAPDEASGARGGGVIMIGPVPIVLGTDRTSALLAAIGGLLVLLGAIVFLWLL